MTTPKKEIKLNLGCGHQKMKGWVNADFQPACNPDVVCDLEQFPWPWKTSSVAEVRLFHVLEHLGAERDVFLGIMKELYRVCKNNAAIHIHVPHPRHNDFITDPTHVRPILAETLSMFDAELNRQWIEKQYANTPLGIYCNVNFHVEHVEYVLDQNIQHLLANNTIKQEELVRLINMQNNVCKEIKMIVHCVKGKGKTANKTPNVVPARLDGIDPFTMHVHPEGSDSFISPSLRATGMWEPFETQIFKCLCKRGYAVLDVGANIGWYTVVAGLLTGPTGRVVAVEPSPDNAALLQKNIHVNKLGKYTTLEQCALSDIPGEAALYLAPSNMGDHRLAAAADSRHHVNVRVCTIDELWQNERGQFDIVKMDAQGFEAKIMNGAEKCFAAGWRPILFFEFSPGLIARAGDDPLQFLTNIFDKNYKLFRIDARQRQLYSITIKDLTPIFEASKKNDEAYVDIVAIPIENDAIAAMTKIISAAP